MTSHAPPIAPGDDLGGWRVATVEPVAGRVCIHVTDPAGRSVTLAARRRVEGDRAGPFDVGDATVYYESAEVPFHALAPAGRALAAALLAAAGPGASPAAVADAWLAAGSAPVRASAGSPWEDQARAWLTGRLDATLRLGAFLGDDALPAWPCTLPWTRMELNEGGTHGPCCSEYQVAAARAPATSDVGALWNSPTLQAFRRAMVSGRHPAPCKRSCPVLHAGTERASDLLLRGGPPASVEAQLAVAGDILAGRAVASAGPLVLCVSTTSYCNYDCLMCDCGETGTLADERPAAFWAGLEPLLPGLQQVVANGGEPLASPAFRAFLEETDFPRYPQLEIALTTNGSYLTPSQLARYARVPFGQLTLSLNAATPESYLAVNRGLPWGRIREHLDALCAARRAGRVRAVVSYSMVILRRNVGEIRAFADLARADDVEVRFLLPNRDRNGQSVLMDRDAMRTARDALAEVAAQSTARGADREARGILGSVSVLDDRLRRGVLAVL